MPGAVTRQDFLAALRVLKPSLVPDYERCRSRKALRALTEEALACFTRLVKRHHPDQGGSDAKLIRLVRARDILRQALALMPKDEPSRPPLHPAVQNLMRNIRSGTLRYDTLKVTINGKEVDLGGVSIEFVSP